MRTLYDGEFNNLDISSSQELAQFSITDASVALITMINVDNLSGVGGEYDAKLFVDNRLIVPDRKVYILGGYTSVSFQSRDLVLYAGGILSINLQGLAGDTNVSGRLIVIDTSPVTVQEVQNIVLGLTPTIVDTIEDSIDTLNVTVRPETKVLGPCASNIKGGLLKPIPKSVVSIPKVIKCNR